MDLLLGVLLIAFGVVTLVKGELKLSNSKISRGGPAKLAGVLLILALPIAFLAQMVNSAMNAAGTPLLDEATSAVMTYLVLIIVALVALVVALRGTSNPAAS
jgi:hypothetical protein